MEVNFSNEGWVQKLIYEMELGLCGDWRFIEIEGFWRLEVVL